MLEYSKSKKHKITEESSVPEVKPEPKIEPETKVIPTDKEETIKEEKVERKDPIKRELKPTIDFEKLSELTEKIYRMGKIPRSVIKAIRHFVEIVTFSKKK
jgi:hypothetical protein